MAHAEPASPLILIVDDHRALRTLTRLVVADLAGADGVEVREAANAAEAESAVREAWQDGRPVFALLDHHIPGRSGLDALRSLDARRAPTPTRFILISSYLSAEMRQAAFDLGADDVLERSSDVDAFRERLQGRFEQWLAAARVLAPVSGPKA